MEKESADKNVYETEVLDSINIDGNAADGANSCGLSATRDDLRAGKQRKAKGKGKSKQGKANGKGKSKQGKANGKGKSSHGKTKGKGNKEGNNGKGKMKKAA